METKTFFDLLSEKHDLMIWLIIFLIILTNKMPSIREEENNWDELRMVRKLTPEQIRAEPGYEYLSDEEVHNIIESNYQLSLLCYHNYKSNQQNFYISE